MATETITTTASTTSTTKTTAITKVKSGTPNTVGSQQIGAFSVGIGGGQSVVDTATITTDTTETSITTPSIQTSPSATTTTFADAVGGVSVTTNVQSNSETVVPFPFNTLGTNWYLNRLVQGEAIEFDGEVSNYPDITIGEETTFEFYIKEDSVGQTTSDKYNRVKDFEKYAGYAEASATLNSAYYSEPDSFSLSPIDSLLVSIEPGDDVDEARAIWGIVTDINDSTEIFGAIARVEISVFVLAEYDDFADRSAVETEYKSDF